MYKGFPRGLQSVNPSRASSVIPGLDCRPSRDLRRAMIRAVRAALQNCGHRAFGAGMKNMKNYLKGDYLFDANKHTL